MLVRKVELARPKGVFFTVSECDYVRVMQHKWYYNKRTRQIAATIYGHTISVSRYILDPKDQNIEVDHILRNQFNNTRENLRECTHQENNCNRSKRDGNYTSNFIGVYWHKQNKKWVAEIWVNYRRIYLGGFDSEEKAARAYDEAAKRYHGEFASLNFP